MIWPATLGQLSAMKPQRPTPRACIRSIASDTASEATSEVTSDLTSKVGSEVTSEVSDCASGASFIYRCRDTPGTGTTWTQGGLPLPPGPLNLYGLISSSRYCIDPRTICTGRR